MQYVRGSDIGRHLGAGGATEGETGHDDNDKEDDEDEDDGGGGGNTLTECRWSI